MNLARSTFYSPPMGQRPEDARIVEKIGEICVEYPRYGYRRVTAQLHREGFLVNHKKALRIMREHGLNVRPHMGAGKRCSSRSAGIDLRPSRRAAAARPWPAKI